MWRLCGGTCPATHAQPHVLCCLFSCHSLHGPCMGRTKCTSSAARWMASYVYGISCSARWCTRQKSPVAVRPVGSWGLGAGGWGLGAGSWELGAGSWGLGAGGWGLGAGGWGLGAGSCLVPDHSSADNNLVTAASFCKNGAYVVAGTYDGRCVFFKTAAVRQSLALGTRALDAACVSRSCAIILKSTSILGKRYVSL